MRLLALSLVFISFFFQGFATKSFDPVRVESFIDGVIASKMHNKNIAGATLCIIKDGGIIIKKGYGYSNYSERTLVNPDETLFRIGSVSKLFVWLAVMQQVERGNLDLNRDINDYLVDFKIPNTFEGPITLTHLMSHTPGFEDKLIKLFTLDPNEIKPLSEILKNEIPARIRPAGLHASYSNHGTAIAAHIVEIVSGMSWDDYVEKNIIFPLGLKSTTFRQPLPESLAPFMSHGYKYVAGEMVEKPFEIIPLSPAGAATTNASDMAVFMQMILNRGSYNGVEILDTATFNLMMKPVMFHAEGVNPCRFGFMDVSHKGVKIIGHGGDTFWFHSLIALIPDQDLGLFLSFNTDGGGGTYVEVFDKLFDQFLVENFEPLPAIKLATEDLKKFEGEYMVNRYPHNDYLKLISLMARFKITSQEEKLKIRKDGKTEYWLPVGELLFQKENEADLMAFELDANGNVKHAFDGRMAIYAFDRVNFFQSQGLHLAIFVSAIVLSLIVLLYWPMVYFIRKRYQPMSIAKRPLSFSSKSTAWIGALLYLVFIIGIATALGDVEASVFSVPSSLKSILILPFILIVITLLMIYHVWLIWKYGGTRIRSRIFYTLLFVVNVLAIWQINYWNFLGWNY